MINLEHKLTVDDLIVEYMIYKVKNGYEASFLISEFMDFLLYFESKMEVYDTLYDGLELFERFFDRKKENDWFHIVSYSSMEKEKNPHMDMVYNSVLNEYEIKANYKLSEFDLSCINTYFMDNGMGRFNKGRVIEIRNIIKEYLCNKNKRKLDENIEVTDNELMIGKYVAARIVVSIWSNYIEKHVENKQWPTQCRSISKYLFDIDLADIIGLKSIKDILLDIYNVFSNRIAILYHNDNNLKICSSYRDYLSRSNYELLINGYEAIMNEVYKLNVKLLEINFSNMTFNEMYSVIEDYGFDEEYDMKKITISMKSENVRKLVRKIEGVKDEII